MGFISAAAFGLVHYYGVYYIFNTFIGGLVLALTYFLAKRKHLSPFGCVYSVHALRNLVVIVLLNYRC